ncbi:MAG: 1-(5-phosphoribosyl)-5-[(5-phosphoribosylamino)methylideneamino]imidazole-4-carboxamide isomerase [Thermaerobacter sp.]|nr:1-(5-phosphoribosyl)-5-[(5-phosphoribosylamino)methylideneamino]imidazole-4-carboxamide isomerase [Thermaerobacter sp.]
MQIIPAIDLLGGQVVRLRQGDFQRKTVYAQDPVAVACSFVQAGARRLHLVDLDGAREGTPRNLEVLAQVRRAVSATLEVGGGLRDRQALDQAFRHGADLVVLGTQAALDAAFLEDALARHPGRVVVAVDAREGRVAVEGWQRVLPQTADQFLAQLRATGVEEVIYTDVGRDGTLEGPNFRSLEQAGRSGIPVIASGGVSSLEDVRRLAVLPGIRGIIIGRALYDGRVDLAAAIAQAGGE